MKRLLVGAWIVFGLDLVLFGLMVRQSIGAFAAGEVDDEARVLATTVTAVAAVWLCLVNLVLVVGWWRDSRAWLWAAVAGGALPLLWVWAAMAEVFTEWVVGPR